MIKALKICGYVSAVICVVNVFYSIGMYRIVTFDLIFDLAGGAFSLIGFLSLAKHLENKKEIKRLLSEISQKLNKSGSSGIC